MDLAPRGRARLATADDVGLLLALVHDVEGLMWFSAIILATHSARRLLERGHARRGIDAITEATLIGFGIKLGLTAK